MESSLLSDEQISLIYAWPKQRSFRLNMILTADDTSTGPDGTSDSLTSPEDRRILKAIRKDADVVIVGAQSLRLEGWFLPPYGRLAVITRSGELPWESCPDRSRVATFPSMSALLHSLTINELNILCEGGITTASQLSEIIGFDDIALTRINKEPESSLPAFIKHAHDLRLESTLTDHQNHMTFQLWRRAVEHQ